MSPDYCFPTHPFPSAVPSSSLSSQRRISYSLYTLHSACFFLPLRSRAGQMRRKQLEMFLQRLRTYDNPRLELEQYATTPELATSILFAINEEVGLDDDEGGSRLIADLGCGCGVLMLGAAQFSSDYLLGIDIDEKALAICGENVMERSPKGVEGCDLLRADVTKLVVEQPRLQGMFDVVVCNPPFGTKNNSGNDWAFVLAGVSMLRPDGGCLYSLHKRATRQFLLRKSKQTWTNQEVGVECVAELRWNLDKTYRHQKATSLDIEVDLLRFRLESE